MLYGLQHEQMNYMSSLQDGWFQVTQWQIYHESGGSRDNLLGYGQNGAVEA